MEWFLWHELNRSVPVKPVDDRLKVLCPRIKHHCFQFTKVLESNLAFICICLFIYRQVLFQLLTDSLLYCNFVPRRSQYVLANGWVVMGYIFLKERDTDRCSPCNARLLHRPGSFLKPQEHWKIPFLNPRLFSGVSCLKVFNGAWHFQSLSSSRSPNLTLGSFDQATDGKSLMSWQIFLGVFVRVHKASLVFWNDGGQWP